MSAASQVDLLFLSRADVERLTGRKVAAFMSDNHVDPDIAAETFVLELREPQAGDEDDTGRAAGE